MKRFADIENIFHDAIWLPDGPQHQSRLAACSPSGPMPRPRRSVARGCVAYYARVVPGSRRTMMLPSRGCPNCGQLGYLPPAARRNGAGVRRCARDRFI